MKKRKYIALLVCAVLLMFLSGCGRIGGRELYQRLLIHGIGVDREGEGFLVTVRSNLSSEDDGEELFKCRGETVLDALSTLSRSTGRQPFYAHNYLVVFGMDCAERGLDDCMDFFIRYYNTRPSVELFLAEGRAEDILSLETDGKLLKMSQLQQLSESGNETGRAVSAELLDFANRQRNEGSAPVMPVIAPRDGRAEIVASAYFNGCALGGILDDDGTRGYLAVKNKLRKSEAVVSGSFGTATLTISRCKGKVSPSKGGDGKAQFDIDITVSADLSDVTGELERPDSVIYREMESELSALIKNEAEGALEKCCGDGCDIFGFGALVRRTCPSYWRTVRDGWSSVVQDCYFNVSVSSAISKMAQ